MKLSENPYGPGYNVCRFTRDGDDYVVYYRGQRIGKVWKAWFALHGEGWTFDGVRRFDTRAEAARKLSKEAPCD